MKEKVETSTQSMLREQQSISDMTMVRETNTWHITSKANAGTIASSQNTQKPYLVQ